MSNAKAVEIAAKELICNRCDLGAPPDRYREAATTLVDAIAETFVEAVMCAYCEMSNTKRMSFVNLDLRDVVRRALGLKETKTEAG